MRAQLEAETRQQVMATDSAEATLDWLATTRFALVILDTRGISPESLLVETLRTQQTPLVLLTGAFDRDQWQVAITGLNVRSVLTRPVFIGELARAVRRAVTAA